METARNISARTSISPEASPIAAASRMSAETGHPGNGIRPCVADLIETPLAKGGSPNRNVAALIIASELRRIGLDYDSVLARCDSWNRFNDPPLKPRELKKAVDNAFAKDYYYGCGNPNLRQFCVEGDCPFQNRVVSNRKRTNNQVFVSYGWPRHLSNRQNIIYFQALPFLERKRRVGPGGIVYASHRQVAETCGISRKDLGRDLEALARAGLIEYKAGQPFSWRGMASEIRRVIPIPRPTRDRLQRLKGDDI